MDKISKNSVSLAGEFAVGLGDGSLLSTKLVKV